MKGLVIFQTKPTSPPCMWDLIAMQIIYMILIDNIYEIDRKDRQTVDLMYIDIIILLMLILSNID